MTTTKVPYLIGLLALLLLQGCATLDPEFGDPRDPYEDVNRNIYKVNEIIDLELLQPISRGYQAIMPALVIQGVSNFFSNLSNVTTLVNSLFQTKFEQAGQTAARFALNSTAGILGLMDVATEMGVPKHTANFTETLGTWGVATGPYIMLPLLGPSSVTGIIGYAADWWTKPLGWLPQDTPRYSLRGLSLIEKRAALLPATKIIEQTPDPYAFVRDAYLQQQHYKINPDTDDEWADDDAAYQE